MNRIFTSALMVASAALLLTTPVIAQEAPAAPGDLVATVIDGPNVEITWTDNSTNETIFLIYRANSPDGPWGGFWDVSWSTSWTDSTYNLVGGPIYYYQVTAYDEATCLESLPSNTAEAVLPVGIPWAPNAFEATAAPGPVGWFAWGDASWNEDSFIVSMSTTGPNGTYYDLFSEPTNVGAHFEPYLPPWSILYFKIRTHNAYGDSECVGPMMVETGPWMY